MKYIIPIICFMFILSGCSENKKTEIVYTESETEKSTENTTTDIKTEEMNNKLNELRKRAGEKGLSIEKIDEIEQNLKDGDVEPEILDKYENELMEINKIIESDENIQGTENSLFEENENVIILTDEYGVKYRLDHSENSITVFNLQNEVLNVMYLVEDGEDHTVFEDGKSNKFILSENENGELVLTDSLNNNIILSNY